MKARTALPLAVVLGLALAARLVWLDDAFNINEPDEWMYLNIAEHFARGSLYPRYDYSPYGDGLMFVPPVPLYLAALVFRVLGASLWTFRAMNVAFGVASVAAFHALAGLYLKGPPRLVATLLFALSPLALYESTLAMLGAPAICFMLVSLWAYVRFTRDGRGRHLVVAAICLGATAACKQHGVLLGGLVAVHWCWMRAFGGGPRLRGLWGALGIAGATFCALAPWVFWRPYASLHCYLLQYWSRVALLLKLLRGEPKPGTLFSLPYPELMVAHALVAALGLATFLATWRRRWDVLAFYGLLLGVPVALLQEVRYLGVALPAGCLFAGYLLAATAEVARGRSRVASGANLALAVVLSASVLPAAVVPWRAPSGLVEACRYVAEHTRPAELVMANYWRPVVERFSGRRMPHDWLDSAGARGLIARGAVAYVVLDDSEYTRKVLHSDGRARVAAWVRATFPLARSFPAAGGGGTGVYRTRRPPAGPR